MKRLVIAAALAAASVLAQAAVGAPVYNFKLDAPVTGSNIRHSFLMRDSQVALNRRSAELTDEEKRLVRDVYETMAAADEPPYPSDGLLPVLQAIAEGSRALNGARGRMSLVATVNAVGDVDRVQLLGEGAPGMNQVAAQVLMLTKFKPAVCGGQPCKMDYPLRIEFMR
jgi:hypothetical protein